MEHAVETDQPRSSTERVYVYSLSHPETHEVRYIGKTIRPRVRYQQHLRCKTSDGNPRKTAWVRKLRECGVMPVFAVLEDYATDAEACAAEIRLIAHYRALGHRLTNLTDGGEGAPARVYTADQLRNVVAANRRTHKGKVTPLAVRAKMSAAQKGRKQTPERVARWVAAMAPVFGSRTWREKIAASLRGQRRGADAIARGTAAAQATRERKRAMGLAEHTPAGLASIGAAARARMLEPERRAQLGHWQKEPQARARVRAEQTARWADPAYRARQLAAMARAAELRRTAALQQHTHTHTTYHS